MPKTEGETSDLAWDMSALKSKTDIEAAMHGMAQTLGLLFHHLMRQGFTRDEALPLVQIWLRTVLAGAQTQSKGELDAERLAEAVARRLLGGVE